LFECGGEEKEEYGDISFCGIPLAQNDSKDSSSLQANGTLVGCGLEE
jgi:hypothetical protein